MANVVGRTLIHKPNSPNLVIEHISGLEEHGATAVLLALGYIKTGVDGVWYSRDNLTIIDNPGVSRKISNQYHNTPNPPLIAVNAVLENVTDAEIKSWKEIT